MEEEAPSRPSVAELAGRFKGSAPPHDAAGNETEKPVRRRPPRSLQLPKTHEDDQEPPGVTSPLPGKAKRNSALIEKLQANLVLSPTGLLPSPKSPGFRLLPPAFTPTSAPVTTVTTSSMATPTSPVTITPLTEEEGPTSFEAPPTAEEGSILSSINKGRARHSIRRRPPSRRHRKSSSGDEVGVANKEADTPLSSPSEPDDKTTEGGEEKKKGGGGGGEEDKTECPEEDESHKEDPSKNSAELRGEEEEKREEEEEDGENGSMAGEEVKTEEEDQEKSSGGKQKDDQTNADRKEEKSEETKCQS